jgi:hypothetical protein
MVMQNCQPTEGDRRASTGERVKGIVLVQEKLCIVISLDRVYHLAFHEF